MCLIPRSHALIVLFTESGLVGVARESAAETINFVRDTRKRNHISLRARACVCACPLNFYALKLSASNSVDVGMAVSWPTSAHKTLTQALTPFIA